ncbi:MAG: NUDIX hydrolase [Ruminococcaceae bacterium]|nr:NUDIX hydrolase [Oscillospiraceae bacterium]
MENKSTDWGRSVAGVVLKDNKVLLARHTYGNGTGLLVIPGGYLEQGETPQEALKREFLEETGIVVEPRRLIGIRFNSQNWYAVFTADHISGEPHSDHDENSEVVWMDAAEVMDRDDVPDLTKALIRCALNEDEAFGLIPFVSNSRHGPGYLYGSAQE